MVDAVHFLDAYDVYASIEKQIASSSVFIINKIDIASAEAIEGTKKVIRQFHPDPLFFETSYADLPLGQFFEFIQEASADSETAPPEKEKLPVLSAQELDEFIDDLLDSPDLEITPPDTLMSVAYCWKGDDLDQIKTMIRQLPAAVVRAKGLLSINGGFHLLNYVMGDWTIEEIELPQDRIKHKNIVVFIGPPETMDSINKASQTGCWENKGAFQPYSR